MVAVAGGHGHLQALDAAGGVGEEDGRWRGSAAAVLPAAHPRPTAHDPAEGSRPRPPRGPAQRPQLPSPNASGRVAAASRAGLLCRGGCEGDGEIVKMHPEGKYVVDLDKSIDITKIPPSTRVALGNGGYKLHHILPSKVDPLVNLMKVEKAPDSTNDVIGGLDQQMKEIKEVIELPIQHPELFESTRVDTMHA